MQSSVERLPGSILRRLLLLRKMLLLMWHHLVKLWLLLLLLLLLLLVRHHIKMLLLLQLVLLMHHVSLILLLLQIHILQTAVPSSLEMWRLLELLGVLRMLRGIIIIARGVETGSLTVIAAKTTHGTGCTRSVRALGRVS